MLLVYSQKVTNRVGYVFNLVFKTILGTDFEITSDSEYFANHQGAKICYSATKVCEDCVFIKSQRLLFQHSIENLDIECFEDEGVTVFFGNGSSETDMPFDIFAASFFLVSRYEEYLPFRTNEYGCFCATDSFAYKNGFLEKPVVDIWAWRLANIIHQKYPQWEMPKKYFNFISTVNIGQAYKYKRIGLLRTLYGYFHDMGNRNWRQVSERTKVLLSCQPDPYDSYGHIVEVSEKYRIKTLFWSLMCDYSPYDHNISYKNSHLRTMLKSLADFGKVGILLSYESTGLLQKQEAETERLAEVLHKPIIRSRFNNHRFHLPEDYKNLVKIGVEKDYSMGYHDVPGFRAGTCSPFHFFNLETNREYNLLVFPTPVPESILAKQSPDEVWKTISGIIESVNSVGGTFVNGWKSECFVSQTYSSIYEQILELCKKNIDSNQLKHR